MKGKQNDKRKRISEGKCERVGEDIRGFNEMLCGLKGQQVRRSKGISKSVKRERLWKGGQGNLRVSKYLA
jgi:hypothetical protein